MQTPVKLTLDGFYLGRVQWLAAECYSNNLGKTLLCRKCGGRIKVQPAVIEIHDAANGQCKGNGESFEAGVPYCPACEELPASVGCVHA